MTTESATTTRRDLLPRRVVASRRVRRMRAGRPVRPWLVALLLALPAVVAAPARLDAGETRAFLHDAARSGGRSGWTTPSDDAAGASAGATGDGERRLYVTGMVGSSLAPPPTADGAVGPLGGAALAGEGAVGVAIPQPVGGWRLEVEGRHRAAARPGEATSAAATTAAGEWATTANAWRDVPLVGNVSAYAGGGLGCGGTADATGSPRGGAVAWKTGGGLAWAWTERVTFDVGYRLQGLEGGGTAGAAPVGEVLFAVRVFEPFRAWRRE